MKDLPLLFLCLVIFAGFHGLRFYQSDINAGLTRPVRAGTDVDASRISRYRDSQQSWQVQSRYAGMQYASRDDKSQQSRQTRDHGYPYRDGDSRLSRHEARHDPMLLKHWEALDRNGDGYLQPFEYAYF